MVFYIEPWRAIVPAFISTRLPFVATGGGLNGCVRYLIYVGIVDHPTAALSGIERMRPLLIADMTDGRHLLMGVTINGQQYALPLYHGRWYRPAGTVNDDIGVMAGAHSNKISIEEVIDRAKGEMIAKIVANDPINGTHIAVELLDEFGVGTPLKHTASILLGGELNQQHFGLIDTMLSPESPGKQRKNENNNTAERVHATKILQLKTRKQATTLASDHILF